MKRSICIISLFVFTFLSSISLKGQEDYSHQLNMMGQVSSLVEQSHHEDALDLLKSNYEPFHQDQVTKFWYDWLNGVILYQIDQYEEAYMFITDAISFLDSIEEELPSLNMTKFLQVYYYATKIESNHNFDKETLIGDLEHAKYIYEKANAIDNEVYSWILTDLGNLKMDIDKLQEMAMFNYLANNLEEAIPQMIEIINFYKTYRPNNFAYVDVQKILGVAFSKIGDYKNSEKQYLEALETLDSNGRQGSLTYRQLLSSLGVLYNDLHNYEKASDLCEHAKILYEKVLDFGDDYVASLSNLAISKYGLGYASIAKMLLDVARNQAQKNLSDNTIVEKFQEEYLKTKKDKVEEDSNEIVKNFYFSKKIEPYIRILSNISVIYSDLGYYSDAIRSIKEAITISEEYGKTDPILHNNIGSLYQENSKYEQAVKWFQKAYPLCKSTYEIEESGLNLALGLYLSGNSSASPFCVDFSNTLKNQIHDMFAFLSTIERSNFWNYLGNSIPILNMIIAKMGEKKDYGTILDNILETKGLLLRTNNKIRDAILKSDNNKDQEDYNRICLLKKQLMSENNDEKRSHIIKEINDIDKRLVNNVNEYANYQNINSIKWQDIRNNLTSQDISIEFYEMPLLINRHSWKEMKKRYQYYAVILKNNYESPHIIPLCWTEDLLDLPANKIYRSEDLYNLIWKPLEEELKNVKNIYFAADRELHKIGIEYAMMPDEKRIGDKFNLYRLSSTRVLAEDNNEHKKDNAVLYGGLIYDMDANELVAENRSKSIQSKDRSRAFLGDTFRDGFNYLPGTLEEVEDISKAFKTNVNLVTGKSGTEESFKSLGAYPVDIIHLATHGFFWTEEDAQENQNVSFLNLKNNQTSTEDRALSRSGLLFSGGNIGLKGETIPDNIEDGILTALELSNMNLGQVDMVVMSACESGLGETSGEGVFGLQRGFKLAGANSLLMTLWKVDDEATKLLMTEFYKNYLNGRSKQHSLKMAQNKLRENPRFDNPKYWAAFILLDALN